MSTEHADEHLVEVLLFPTPTAQAETASRVAELDRKIEETFDLIHQLIMEPNRLNGAA